MKCPMLVDHESILRWRPTTPTLDLGLDRKILLLRLSKYSHSFNLTNGSRLKILIRLFIVCSLSRLFVFETMPLP